MSPFANDEEAAARQAEVAAFPPHAFEDYAGDPIWLCVAVMPDGDQCEQEEDHPVHQVTPVVPIKPTFFMSFGSGYRRTEFDYDQMGQTVRATRHPVFPDKIDGRGYVEVVAKDYGRARYLAAHYFRNEKGVPQYSGLYDDLEMWEDWDARSTYYGGSPTSFRDINGGTLLLGRLDEYGLRWATRGVL